MTPELSSSGVPLTYLDVLTGTFEDAQDQLKKIVLSPPGKSAQAKEFNSARAAIQLREITQIVAGIKGQSAAWIGSYLPIAFTDGIRRAEMQAKAVGIVPEASPVKGSFSLVDPHTVEVFAHEIYHDLAKAADSMGQRSAKLLRETRQIGLSERDINTVLAGGVITGQPVATIRQLREDLRRVHGNEVQVIDKNGAPINFKVGYYAEMVARTRTREATVTARHTRLEQLGQDLVSVVGRVSKNFCTAYLGQVFSLSGKSSEYPSIKSLPSGGPPFHPNCSKSTRPYVAALATKSQRELAPGVDENGKMLDITPTEAQRRFKDLQLYQQVKERYATTAAKLFGKAA